MCDKQFIYIDPVHDGMLCAPPTPYTSCPNDLPCQAYVLYHWALFSFPPVWSPMLTSVFHPYAYGRGPHQPLNVNANLLRRIWIDARLCCGPNCCLWWDLQGCCDSGGQHRWYLRYSSTPRRPLYASLSPKLGSAENSIYSVSKQQWPSDPEKWKCNLEMLSPGTYTRDTLEHS